MGETNSVAHIENQIEDLGREWNPELRDKLWLFISRRFRGFQKRATAMNRPTENSKYLAAAIALLNLTYFHEGQSSAVALSGGRLKDTE